MSIQSRNTMKQNNHTQMMTKQDINDKISFGKYLVQKPTIYWLITAIVGNVIIYTVLKALFPNADFVADSNTYLMSADNRVAITYRPVGYPNFLNFMGFKGGSENRVVLIQYLLTSVSSIFLFFTLTYFYPLKTKFIKAVVFIIICFNLMNFFVSNFVLSDALFTGLTVTIFTLSLWIKNTGKFAYLVFLFFIMYVTFSVRFNSLYFPFFIILTIMLCFRMKLAYRVLGSLAVAFTFISFYAGQQKLNEQKFNVRVLAGFSGWQLANNALYIYPYCDIDISWFETRELRNLHKMVDTFFKQIDSAQFNDIYNTTDLSAYFIWQNKSPLKQYLFRQPKTMKKSYFYNWVNISKLYSEYGNIIIRNNKGAFFKYHLMKNAKTFIYPQAEFFTDWEFKTLQLPEVTTQWFSKTSVQNNIRNRNLNDRLVNTYRVLYTVLISLTIAGIMYTLGRLFKSRQLKFEFSEFRTHIIIGSFFCMTAAFSIYASAIVFRNILFLIPVLSTWLYLMYFYTEQQKNEPEEGINQV